MVREMPQDLPVQQDQDDIMITTTKRVSISTGMTKMDDDNTSVGAGSYRRWRSDTIVSLVVPDRFQNDNEKKKKKIFTPSIVEYVKVLSILYAIVMTIVGFIFPISEALTNTWLQTNYNAVFMSYQLVVGIVFLVYLQVFALLLKRRTPQKILDAANDGAGSPPETRRGSYDLNTFQDEESTNNPTNNPTNNNNNDVEADSRNYLSAPSTNIRPKNTPINRFRIRNGEDVSGSSTPVGGSPRLPIRRQMLQQKLQQLQQLQQLQDLRRPSTDIDLQANYPSEEEISLGPSVVWMDVSKFGSIFSHEGSSLFLKIGALLFSLGNIIYYSLEIENNMNRTDSCQTRFGWTFILRLAFVLVQTFFIFKGPEVHVKKHLPIVWFGMLHLVSTNICLWFRIVVREIMEEFAYGLPNGSNNDSNKNDTEESRYPYKEKNTELSCENALLHASSRYLFPFVLEYSLIAVGTIACIVYSISQPTDSEGNLVKGLKNLIKVCSFQKTADSSEDVTSIGGASITSDVRSILNKSHGGMFLGALFFAGIIVAIVLFYFNGSQSSATVYLITDLVLHSCLLIGCIMALILIRPLAYVAKPLSTDDALLVVAMCGSAMFEISVMIASSATLQQGDNIDDEPLLLSTSLVAAVHTLIQTMLILCALRRYPSSEEHMTKMPGRGTFTFLIVGNVAVWVLRTALTKAVDMTTMTSFYGEVAWLLIANFNLPLLLFFHFHCSVCFADIWHVAYTPLHNKLRKMKHQSAPAAGDELQYSESVHQIPQICIISPPRSSASDDTISVASFRSTTM